MKSNRRRHGVEQPLEQLQILTWIAVVCNWVIFFSLIIPFLPDSNQPGSNDDIRHPVLATYLCIVVVGLPVYIWLLLHDPKHPHLDTKSLSGDDGVNRGPVSHCHYCMIDVDNSTKHCRLCNKCIQGFDHHCLYLNTCIGQSNYWPFFVVISLVTIMIGIQLVLTIIIIVNHDEPGYRDLIDGSIFGGSAAYISVLSVVSVIPLIGFGAIVSLEAFHIYIIVLGITTYGWIIARRERKEKEIELEMEARQKERDAKQAAIREQWLKEREIERKKKQDEQERLESQKSSNRVEPSPFARPKAGVDNNVLDEGFLQRERQKSLEEDDDTIAHRMSILGVGDFREVNEVDKDDEERILENGVAGVNNESPTDTTRDDGEDDIIEVITVDNNREKEEVVMSEQTPTDQVEEEARVSEVDQSIAPANADLDDDRALPKEPAESEVEHQEEEEVDPAMKHNNDREEVEASDEPPTDQVEEETRVSEVDQPITPANAKLDQARSEVERQEEVDPPMGHDDVDNSNDREKVEEEEPRISKADTSTKEDDDGQHQPTHSNTDQNSGDPSA